MFPSSSSKTGFAAVADQGHVFTGAAASVPVQSVETKDKASQRIYFCWKRVFDVFLATMFLIMLLPLMLLIASLIKLDSPGPVLFIQNRIGVKRRTEGHRVVWIVRPFAFYKFRSMVTNADQSLHESYVREFREGRNNGSGNGTAFKLSNDSRVTRFGRILRKTSLDELPQLVNVLKGDMSLVGPRPVPTYEVALYANSHYERLSALPGITGLWQVKGRCQVPFEEMMRMDIEYARQASLWLDAKILLLTIPAVLSGRGAK
jgi:lipopolysaccharide/colanic/teichoic acid biosynthesis glycosyltransferase